MGTTSNRDDLRGNPAAPAYGAGAGSFKVVSAFGLDGASSRAALTSSPFVRHGRAQVANIHRLLYAIKIALDDGRLDENAPPVYRAALIELLEARSDRGDTRKTRFEHSLRMLSSALAIAESDSELFSLKRLWKIDSKLATWERLCALGPAQLPRPETQHLEKFQYPFIAKGGESVLDAARSLGLKNPWAVAHPAYGYEPYMRLRKGDTIWVPMPPAQLKELIATSEELIEGAREHLEALLQATEVHQQDLEATLTIIEGVSVMANVLGALAAGIQMAAHTTRLAAKLSAHGGEHMLAHLNKHMLLWVGETLGHTAAEFLGWGLEMSHSWQGFLARHPNFDALWRSAPGLSWLSPNYWAPLVAAGWCGTKQFGFWISGRRGEQAAAKRDQDELLEMFFLGREGFSEKARITFEQSAERQIDRLESQIEEAKSQLDSPVYEYKP